MIAQHRLFFLLAFLIFLLASCKEKSGGPTDSSLTGNQVNIPWPGLASSPWPARNHDPQHTGRSEYRGPQSGRMGWLYDAGSPLYASPVLGSNGTIYFGGFNSGDVIALTPTGSEFWKSSPGGSDGSFIVGNDGTIYCSAMSPDGARLFAYNPSGSLKWSLPVADRGGFAPYTPTISKDGETIYVPHGILYAVSKTGTLRWKFVPDSTDQVGLYPSMSPDGATLYAEGQGALYALDTSGTLKWRITPRTSEVALDNAGNLYFTQGPSDLVSATPQGKERWRVSGLTNGEYQAGPAIGWDGTIYLAGRSLWAVSAEGAVKWEVPLPEFSQAVPAIDRDGTIYVGRCTLRSTADSLNFLAVNPNGTIKFQVCLRGSDGKVPDIDSNPAISGTGSIYVGSDRPSSRWFFEVK